MDQSTAAATQEDNRHLEFRKLDIIVRDNEYVAGRRNVTTVGVRNTYQLPISLGQVSARHSTMVSAEEDRATSGDDRARKEASSTHRKSGLLSTWIRQAFAWNKSDNDKSWVELKDHVEAGRPEPILIKADGNSVVDLSTTSNSDRRMEIIVSEGASVRISDQNKTLLSSTSISPASAPFERKAQISATSEKIMGFTWTTKNWLLFIPARVGIDIEVPYEVAGDIRSQVASCTFDIKPPIYSIVIGGIAGSLIGSVARSLTAASATFDVQFAVKIAGSCFLSIMAVVALSRKSGSQAFITVEDFFGAFVLGSLIGYGGATFFEQRVLPGFGGGGEQSPLQPGAQVPLQPGAQLSSPR